MAQKSKQVVVVAILANVVIAAAKAIAGAMVGSNAMLAEAGHSIADTANQGLMLVSISLARRPADESHPFGYGKERFFWAFVAAMLIFGSGAAYAIYNGVDALVSGSQGDVPAGNALYFTYAVLAIAFCADGTSFINAFRSTRTAAKAAKLSLLDFVRDGKDPTVKVVLLEDAAALTGLIFAGTGLALYQVTGHAYYDAAASIFIGVLLAGVAVALGADAKGLLLGEAALPIDRQRIAQVIQRHEGIEHLADLRTMAVGPNSLVVAARVHWKDSLGSCEIERLAFSLDKRLREDVPTVREVFLDPTARAEPPPPKQSRAECDEE